MPNKIIQPAYHTNKGKEALIYQDFLALTKVYYTIMCVVCQLIIRQGMVRCLDHPAALSANAAS